MIRRRPWSAGAGACCAGTRRRGRGTASRRRVAPPRPRRDQWVPPLQARARRAAAPHQRLLQLRLGQHAVHGSVPRDQGATPSAQAPAAPRDQHAAARARPHLQALRRTPSCSGGGPASRRSRFLKQVGHGGLCSAIAIMASMYTPTPRKMELASTSCHT